ncbi:TPA: hypothetical protein ACNMTD_005753, partial [Klebsiella pneumoniae]
PLQAPSLLYGPLISDDSAKFLTDFGGFLHSGVELSLSPFPGRYYRERPTRMNTVNVSKLPRRYIRINYLAKDPAKNKSIFLPKKS